MKKVGKLQGRAALVAVAAFAATAMTLHSERALASEGGAFVGGLIGGHVLTRVMDNSERRTRAAEHQAYQSQQPQVVYQQAPASGSGGKSVEQRLEELDSLAAKGYISQSEYKARRKEILDSL